MAGASISPVTVLMSIGFLDIPLNVAIERLAPTPHETHWGFSQKQGYAGELSERAI